MTVQQFNKNRGKPWNTPLTTEELSVLLVNNINEISLNIGTTAKTAEWGFISGTLGNQTDLITALNAKQPLDALLTALSALVTSSDRLIYCTGVDTVALAEFTAFARTLLDDSTAAQARTTLGVPSSATTISTVAPLTGGGDLSANRTITTSMATNKLLGRGTAGTGVAEEITLGTNISLSGTTLNVSAGSYTYPIPFNGSFFSPADSTTYVHGGLFTLAPTASSGGTGRRFYVAVPGTLTRASIYVLVGGTLGTAENVGLYARLNNTTDVTLTVTSQWNSTFVSHIVTGLSQAVVAGDYFEIKIVTPAWATNPTDVYIVGNLIVQV